MQEISPLCSDGVFLGVRPTDPECSRVAPVKGWTVQRAAAESLVPAKMGRRTGQTGAADMIRSVGKVVAHSVDTTRPNFKLADSPSA